MIGKAGAGFPTAQFLCDEIRHGEDVELLIEKTGDPKSAHAITLVGIDCDDPANMSIQYQDPNSPNVLQTVPIGPLVGKLVFNYPGGRPGVYPRGVGNRRYPSPIRWH